MKKEQEQQMMAEVPMKTQNMNSFVQIKKKRPKMKFQDKLEQEAMEQRQVLVNKAAPTAVHKKYQKVLDAVLLSYSCRVKNPH